MIENLEQKMLKLKHQLVEASIEADKGNTMAFYREKDREHENIQSELIAMIESLSMIHGNLESLSDSNNRTYGNWEFDLAPINQTIKKLSQALYFDVPATLCEYQLRKAEKLWELENFDEAYLAWARILKHDPTNKFVHRRLCGLSNSYPGVEKFRDLHHDCRLEYIESFGHEILKQAGKIIAAGPENTIFVSDHIMNAIHRFTAKGENSGTISANLNYPLGLFTDPEYNLWICDMKNCRLTCCNPEGKILRQINLRSLFQNQLDFTYPLFGCIYHGCIYLRCSNRYFNQAIFVRLNLNDESFQVIDGCRFLHIEDDIKVYDDILYSHDYHTGLLHRFDIQKNIFEPVLTAGLKGGFRHFVKTGPFYFVCLDNNILKFSQSGEMIFCMPVGKAAGNHSFGANDIEIIKLDNQALLLVTDDRQKCIHKFMI